MLKMIIVVTGKAIGAYLGKTLKGNKEQVYEIIQKGVTIVLKWMTKPLELIVWTLESVITMIQHIIGFIKSVHTSKFITRYLITLIFLFIILLSNLTLVFQFIDLMI